MSYKQCLIDITKDSTLSSEEKKAIADAVDNILKKRNLADMADELSDAVLKDIAALKEDIKISSIKEQRNSALNARRTIDQIEHFKNVWDNAPKEGIKALFDKSILNREGAKNGVGQQIGALQMEYLSNLESRLAQKDLFEVFKSPDFAHDIFIARREMNMKEPNAEVLKKLAPEAVEVAKIINDVNKVAVADSNKAGSWIVDLEGYAGRQSHDMSKIQKAAGADIRTGDMRHAKAWVDHMMENLDWEKTMPDVLPENRRTVLNSMFTQFTSGTHLTFSEGGGSALKGFGNIGKKASHERVLFFKDGEAEFNYWKKFGQGDNMGDVFVGAMSRMARDTAIMRNLGPNAEMNLDKIIEAMEKKYVAEGRAQDAADIRAEFEAQKKNMWPLLTGEANIPASALMAKINQGIRQTGQMALLGKAALNVLPDIAASGATLRYAGERSTGSFFKGVADTVSHMMDGAADKKKFASELGILLGALHQGPTSIHMMEDIPGFMSNITKKFFKMTGLEWTQSNIKYASAMATANRHALHMELSFDKLPAGMSDYMKQFGITSEHWDVMRKAEASISSKGEKFLTPENIKDIPKEKLDSLPEVKERIKQIEEKANGLEGAQKEKYLATKDKLIDAARSNAQSELVSNYRTLMQDIANNATSEPGFAERATMFQGTRPGTWQGEAWRHFWSLKSFTVSTMKKHLARELWGYSAENMSTKQALKALFTGGNNSGAAGLANFIVVSTLFGYASGALKDIVSGKKPRTPTDAASFGKILLASAANSGSMGIYGDFLFGEMKSRFGQSPLETFLGPTFKQANDLVSLYADVKEGKPKALSFFNFALNNTPVINAGYSLFYTRQAMDYLILNRMREAMSPGYLRRMEDRLKKEKDQEYFLKPHNYFLR